ncbi:MAG: serpin family protein [Phycisphaerales bacterium]|nr:serpin family protein [Phycisphaerales bacterium]
MFSTNGILTVLGMIGLLATTLMAVEISNSGVDRLLQGTSRGHETAHAGNRFALELYAKLKAGDSNIFYSPYSISTALAMTWAGARGATAEQMAGVLHFERAAEEIHADFKRLIEAQNEAGQKGDYELSVANALWGQKGYGFLKEYLELVENSYHAALREVDFDRAAEEARKTVNKWVEDKTKEKIKDLLQPGTIERGTTLILTNAIYFKGQWLMPFQEARTKNEPFALSDGTKIDVPMMNQADRFGYTEDDQVQVLELPYVGEGLSMVIILPRQKGGIGDIESMLTISKLDDWLGTLRKRNVVATIPKFTMTCEFSLGDVLQAMGMPLAFSGAADFSGMTGNKDLFIAAVIHKAFVEVNEEGTEAAAATAVNMVRSAMIVKPDPVFRADHPFVFMIRDAHSGAILFVGRVMNPKTA